MSQLQVTGEAKIRDIQGPVVANSGVVTALDGAASQYVRGDGTLADFPTSTGGGSSVSYYLNSSVSQGTIGGVAYRELNREPVIGAGTDITISANGYVASYITDVNDPDLLSVPGGNFNCEFYFSVDSNAHNPSFYAELYKYDGATFTLLGTSAAVPEFITQGTTIAPYYFAIPVATAALALTDRLAIRIYVNVDGRTVTLHTENGHLCQVVTTFSKGMISLNNLTDQSQYLATGTSGTDFGIVSSGDTHTFNLPVASAANTGKLSSTDWSTFNGKVPYTGATQSVNLGGYALTASALNVTNTSTLDGNILLKKAGIAVTTPTYVSQFAASSGVGIGYSDGTGGANFVLQTAAIYDYTFPAITGTLALLEGTQTFSGNKTFSSAVTASFFVSNSGILLSTLGQALAGGNYGAINAGTDYIDFRPAGGGIFKLKFPYSTFRTFTFPDSNGTLALTSDLGGYVTLATAQTISGAKTFSSSPIIDNGTSGIPLRFKQYASTNFGLAGYTDIIPIGANILAFAFGQTGADTKIAYFSAASLTNNVPQEYTLPNATGTIALTSNLSAYLPLTGGTLTGALSGTSATFSSSLIVGSTPILYGNVAIKSNSSTSYFGLNVIANANNNFIALNHTGTAGVIETEFSTGGSHTPLHFVTGGSTRLTIASTGAATFSSSVTAGSGTSSGYATLNLIDSGTGSARYASIRKNYDSPFDLRIRASNSESAAPIVFDLSNAVEAMRITSGGNVGIGTSSPVKTLDVYNSANSNTAQIKVGDGGSTARAYLGTFSNNLYLSCGGTYSSGWTTDGTNGIANIVMDAFNGGSTITFGTAASNTSPSERMRITSGGNVGFNGSSDVANVNDKFSLGYFNSNYGWLQTWSSTSLYLNKLGNAVYAGSVRLDTLSDERVKDNIQPIENALSKVLSITGKKFHLKDEDESKIRYGFIAQELEGVLDEFVIQTDITFKHKELEVENVKSIENWASSWAALLVEAIKEQQAQIEELKALIAAK